MTRLTRSPVNGPGPAADGDRGDVLTHASSSTAWISGGEQLNVPHRVDGGGRGDYPLPVVEGDGHGRGGGVEGEQHDAEVTRAVR